MKNAHYEELADFLIAHKISVDKRFSVTPKSAEKKSDIVKRLKNDKDFRKKAELRKKNLESLKWNFGRKI